MDDAKGLITLLYGIDDDTETDDIVDVLQVDILLLYLLVDAVEVL